MDPGRRDRPQAFEKLLVARDGDAHVER